MLQLRARCGVESASFQAKAPHNRKPELLSDCDTSGAETLKLRIIPVHITNRDTHNPLVILVYPQAPYKFMRIRINNLALDPKPSTAWASTRVLCAASGLRNNTENIAF